MRQHENKKLAEEQNPDRCNILLAGQPIGYFSSLLGKINAFNTKFTNVRAIAPKNAAQKLRT